MTQNNLHGPAVQFERELSSVFVRWWEESDLDETDMAGIALGVIERFCDTTVEFDADFDLGDE